MNSDENARAQALPDLRSTVRDYCVVEGFGIHEFMVGFRAKVDEGWLPIGNHFGVFHPHRNNGTVIYSQMFTRTKGTK